MNKQEWLMDEEAKKRIPIDELKIIDELLFYGDELIKRKLKSNNLKIKEEELFYLYHPKEGYTKSIDFCTNKIPTYDPLEQNEKDRSIDFEIGKKFWYNKEMYYFTIYISSGMNYFLDCEIWILEYLYRNDINLFKKIFNNKEERVVKYDRGTEEKFYYWLFFYENEIDYVKYVIEEIVEWMFSRKELIEVLKGNEWINGYVPSTPY